MTPYIRFLILCGLGLSASMARADMACTTTTGEHFDVTASLDPDLGKYSITYTNGGDMSGGGYLQKLSNSRGTLILADRAVDSVDSLDANTESFFWFQPQAVEGAPYQGKMWLRVGLPIGFDHLSCTGDL